MKRPAFLSSSSESLRKEAKTWLKALHAGDAAAWKRLRKALPQAKDSPSLRDVQLALARERGFSGWTELKTSAAADAADRRDRREMADAMLRQMIWQGDPAIGAGILQRHPGLAGLDFCCAVACGNAAVVARTLQEDPGAAARAGGPLQWEPLLYLAYSRLPGHETQAVEIARLLLEHRADANARWLDDWNNPFTVLTGVLAGGEGVKPEHPRAAEMVELLFAHGADPWDTQALYNTSITSDSTQWLDVLWNACVARGIEGRWRDVPADTGGKHPPVNQLDYLLGNAITHRQPRRAEWLLQHGANPDATHVYTGLRLPDLALAHGTRDIVVLLKRHGALDRPPEPIVALQLACRERDTQRARHVIEENPGLLQVPATLHTAAAVDDAELTGWLLARGMPVDLMDDGGARALHAAVTHDARAAVRCLLQNGSVVDTPTKHYGGAMGAAAHFGRRECAGLLAPHSRDVHNLVRLQMKARLEQLFAEDPSLVNLRHFRQGTTPLFWLPQEEAAAIDMAGFLLAHGADRAAVNPEGRTAAQLATLAGCEALAITLEP